MFSLHVKRPILSLQLPEQSWETQGEQKSKNVRKGAPAAYGTTRRPIAEWQYRSRELKPGHAGSVNTVARLLGTN